MPGGNRAFTLQDVLGQLNQDASGSSTDDSALQINQLALLADQVAVADAVTAATAGTSFNWNDSNAYWGALPWGTSGFTADGGSAPAYTPVSIWDGGNATSTYPNYGGLDGGRSASDGVMDGGGAPSYAPASLWDGGAATSTYLDFASLNGGSAHG